MKSRSDRLFLFSKLIIVGILIVACTGKKEEDSNHAQPLLTQKEAIARFAQVANISYDQEFVLDSVAEVFAGKVDIAFEWKASSDPLRVDFFQGTVKRTVLNGHAVQLRYDGRQIILDASLRKPGIQHLVVEFERGFDPEANGIYRFVDPEDKRVYLYSNLEPNFAENVFPCFDQPDLKATFRMTVKAPADWVVMTSTLPDKVVAEAGGATKVWRFPVSAKMSTYVWSLNAGPYKIIEDKGSHYPQRILTRQSIAADVRVDEWFPVARAAVRYYGEFFGIPYPYKKLDFVIVPDFEWDGMENIAAITMSDQNVKKGPHTHEEKRHIANLILHEIAHMWFGDLVTMKWWDDLWLNESFASFMVGLSMPKAGFAGEGWRDFYSDEKEWAYLTDEKVTTHPIAGDVIDTSQANSNFDGITYGKGASVIKQLMYLLSEEKFRAGTRLYFQRHREGNAVLADFIDALAKTSGRPLQNWSDQWLKTAGLNDANLELSCTAGKIAVAKIHQTALPDHPVLREQAMQIAFLDGTEKLDVKKMFRVIFSGDVTELKQLVGQKCPAIVFPNYNDYAYAKFHLDENSLSELKRSIGRISNPLIRQMAWSLLWSNVRDGSQNVKEFAEIWLREIPKENDDQNLVSLFRYAHAAHKTEPSILMFYPKDEEFRAWQQQTDKMLRAELEKAKPGSDRQKHLADAFIALSSGSDSMNRLAEWLDGHEKIKGLEFAQDQRWEILKRLATQNYSGVEARIDQELKSDPSSAGQDAALTARVSLPSEEVKKASFAKLVNEKADWTFAQRKIVMSGLFPVEQLNLRNRFAARFFATLEKFIGSDAKSDTFLESYMSLTPLEPGPMKMARDFMTKHAVLPETVHRGLLEAIESGEKFQKILVKAGGRPSQARL